MNHNDENKNYLEKICFDINNEVTGEITKSTNDKLKENIDEYKKKMETIDDKKYDCDSLIKKYGVYKKDYATGIYAFIVELSTRILVMFWRIKVLVSSIGKGIG